MPVRRTIIIRIPVTEPIPGHNLPSLRSGEGPGEGIALPPSLNIALQTLKNEVLPRLLTAYQTAGNIEKSRRRENDPVELEKILMKWERRREV